MWSFLRDPNYYKENFTFLVYLFLPSIRMSGKSIIFDEKKIEISNFYKNKKSFKIDDIDAKEILTSKKNQMAQISQVNIYLI